MSFAALEWAYGVLEEQPELTTAERFVLVTLAHAADANHACWLARRRIASRVGVSPSSVSRLLAALERQGLVERQRRFRENGSQTSNGYVLLLPPSSESHPFLPGEQPSFSQLQEGGVTTAMRSLELPLELKEELTRAVNAVWGHYKGVMKPRRDSPDPEQRAIIRAALRVANGDNYGDKAKELCRAIDGCAASPFHMGQNDRRKKYNRLSQILKGKKGGKTTREQIDMFLEIAENAGSQSGFTSASNDRVSQARREVLDGWEFPGDDRVVARANRAKAWLREQGWTIDRDEETERPIFVGPS